MSHHEHDGDTEHEHHDQGTNHGCEPMPQCSVKGPGHTAHDPNEPCDTHDADGNGDDLCPVPVTKPEPKPVPTTTTTQPVPTKVEPAQPVSKPPTTVTTVAQPQPAAPELATTGAGTDVLVFVAIAAVAVGHRLVKMSKKELAR